MTETVALLEIPNDDANGKFNKMPSIVTSYEVYINKLFTYIVSIINKNLYVNSIKYSNCFPKITCF